MKKFLKLGSLFLLLLFIDVACKIYATAFIPKMSWMHPFYPFGGIGVFDNFLGISFSLNRVENMGAAWGIFAAYGKYLLGLRIIIVLVLLSALIWGKISKVMEWPIILVLAGAVGNILDFMFYGHVVDFFYFNLWGYSYPVFNWADIFITIGMIWIFILSFRRKKSEV